MTLPLKQLTKKPICVKQWALIMEKLQALEQLVQEQLDVQHIEESNSSWNFHLFVLKKKP